jgi:hypothetical protein
MITSFGLLEGGQHKNARFDRISTLSIVGVTWCMEGSAAY